MRRDAISWCLCANSLGLVDGAFILPDKPGLSWEFDEDSIAQYGEPTKQETDVSTR
jgi:L-alanine-DL-glutamate epimerase-like enolase superfamily enzyme